ncbi:MAG: CAAX prenyl protease-related protein [Geobacter sp.]|nr:MAG: CAAX prenyl protease-related protein [Geobacter sp.]
MVLRASVAEFIVWRKYTVKNAFYCRIAPFALYMLFIALEQLAHFLSGKGILNLTEQFYLFLYPIKVISVAILLFVLRKSYTEVTFREVFRPRIAFAALGVGICVFVLWINMDMKQAVMGTMRGFNVDLVEDDMVRIFLVLSRLAGAALVVPIMEELFWRSFLIRYIISPDFTKVPIGRFTWPSFLIASVLFGLEHNLFLAGIMAGLAYNLLLYRTRSLSACIVAHGVTNLALGVYVLQTGKWYFW